MLSSPPTSYRLLQRVSAHPLFLRPSHRRPQALRRNPFAPKVPCHRVIAATLDLGGFSGGWGMGCDSVHKKRRLLQEEGVRFDDRGKLLGSDAGAVMTAAELRDAAKAVL